MPPITAAQVAKLRSWPKSLAN